MFITTVYISSLIEFKDLVGSRMERQGCEEKMSIWGELQELSSSVILSLGQFCSQGTLTMSGNICGYFNCVYMEGTIGIQ